MGKFFFTSDFDSFSREMYLIQNLDTHKLQWSGVKDKPMANGNGVHEIQNSPGSYN
jgi:hypothetical protein